MTLAVLSLDARRRLLRFDAVDEARFIPGSGNDCSPSSVLLREEGSRDDAVVRTEVDRCGNSVADESALDEPMSVNRDPCLEGGGGGGDFRLAVVVPLLATSPGVASTLEFGAPRECCDDSVKDELLRDGFSAEECRSWLCLRARGTGGGVLFCCREFDRLSDSLGLSAEDNMLFRLFSEILACDAGGDDTGVGGSGLLVSDPLRGLVIEDSAASVTAKLSNDTVCGCRGDTSLP